MQVPTAASGCVLIEHSADHSRQCYNNLPYVCACADFLEIF